MDLTIWGVKIDMRTGAPVTYAQCSIIDYLAIVGEQFFEFSIQRKREKFTAYSQMRDDIIAGTLLPTITLAVPIGQAIPFNEMCKGGDLNAVRDSLLRMGSLNILDGLQRTHILRDLFDSGHEFHGGQTVHLEIRSEPDLRQLIYRIIVLNAGQKPMSMRHQIEILSLSLKGFLETSISGLELVPEVDGGRRTKARKFALDRVAAAYHAYIVKSPEIEKQNLVAQRLSEETVLHQEVSQFGEQFIGFLEYFDFYCQIDDVVEEFQSTGTDVQNSMSWLGSENTMNAFFAAVSDFGSDEGRINRIRTAISVLIRTISNQESDSSLGLDVYNKITSGFPSRKTNIGYATRKLIFVSFKEFFRDEGHTPLSDIWAREAE